MIIYEHIIHISCTIIIIRTFNMPMEPSTRSYLNEKILKKHVKFKNYLTKLFIFIIDYFCK